MNAIEAINQFVDVMLDSKTAFENIKAEAEQQNKAVEECIARFREDMSRLKSKVDVRDSGLRELSQKQIATLEEMLKTVGGKLESVRRDMQFIKEYEDSFNIAVFGKVKAGKSYTGNFIMGNGLRDLGIHTSYDKIEHVKSWFGARYYTTGTRTHTKTQTIDLGVNLQQVLQEVRAGIDAIFAEKVPEILRRICDSFIAPVSKMRDNADKGIESAIRELEGLKIKA